MSPAVTLALPSGVRVVVDPLGATLAELWLPDREGQLDDVLLGGSGGRRFYGATVGRYANRIAGAVFVLDGQRYQLDANDGPHCLHGGADGFDLRHWDVVAQDAASVTLRLVSPDGDQGFPGRVEASVSYALTGDSTGARLDIEMRAVTDRATPISLTNHAYFNLGGVSEPACLRGIEDHDLAVAASRYLPVNDQAIPLADAPAPVDAVFDLRGAARLGDRLRLDHPQLRAVRGYDHCYALDGEGFRAGATLSHPSGRRVDLWTDQPGLQVYTGNWLDGPGRGKGDALYRMGDAVCLEPGAWPDAPNRPDFPVAILRPGDTYIHRMALDFPAAR